MCLFLVLLLLITPITNCFAGSYTQQKIGNFDYVTGPNGYSGSGQQIGSTYYYHDNQGNNNNWSQLSQSMASGFAMGQQVGGRYSGLQASLNVLSEKYQQQQQAQAYARAVAQYQQQMQQQQLQNQQTMVAAYNDFLRRPFHRAFACSDDGVSGWGFGFATVDEAKTGALNECNKRRVPGMNAPCYIWAIDDTVLGKQSAPSGTNQEPLGQTTTNLAQDVPQKVSDTVAGKSLKKITVSIRAENNASISINIDGTLVFQDVIQKGTESNWSATKTMDFFGKDLDRLVFEVNGKSVGHLSSWFSRAKKIHFTPEGMLLEK